MPRYASRSWGERGFLGHIRFVKQMCGGVSTERSNFSLVVRYSLMTARKRAICQLHVGAEGYTVTNGVSESAQQYLGVKGSGRLLRVLEQSFHA